MVPSILTRLWHASAVTDITFFQRCLLAFKLFMKRKDFQQPRYPTIRLELYGSYGSGKTTFSRAMFGVEEEEEVNLDDKPRKTSLHSPVGWERARQIIQTSEGCLTVRLSCSHRSKRFDWTDYTALEESPGWGRREQQLDTKIETNCNGIILIIHPNEEESQVEKKLCTALAQSQQKHRIPLFILLNAIDIRQKRHSLPIDEERQRLRTRLKESYDLEVDEVEAISSYHGWVAQRVLAQKGKTLSAELEEEWQTCLNRKDEKSGNPIQSVLQRSRLNEVSQALDAFIQKHFLENWSYQTLAYVNKKLEDTGVFLPWLEKRLLPEAQPNNHNSGGEPL